MPWSIEKRDDKWCVVKDDDGETVECHDTEKEARDHQKALYANEPDASIRYSEALAMLAPAPIEISYTANGTVLPDSISEKIAETVRRHLGQGSKTLSAGEFVVKPVVGDVTEAPPVGRQWRGVLALVGSTDDGRWFAEMDWRPLPLPLMWQVSTAQGPHENAVVCGRIDWIERHGRVVIGGGVYNDDERGRYAADRLADQSYCGVSIDALGMGELRCTEFDTSNPDFPQCVSMVAAYDQATICSATQVATPAFAAARLELIPDGESPEQASSALVRLQADAEKLLPPDPEFPEPPPMPDDPLLLLMGSAGRPSEVHPPLEPPREWFEVPEPPEFVPLHITAEGQVMGHIAAWNECHTGFPGTCVTPPPSPSGYAIYNRPPGVVCADGSVVKTGPLTLTTSHAGTHLDAARAMSHYDNTGCAVADVVATDGVIGPWVCGAARPTITPEQIREFHASSPSGDWRPHRGPLDLIAVLMVNTPGFLPLVASGIRSLGGGRTVQDSLIISSRAGVTPIVVDPLEERVRKLEDRLARVEPITRQMLERMEPELWEALRASIETE